MIFFNFNSLSLHHFKKITAGRDGTDGIINDINLNALMSFFNQYIAKCPSYMVVAERIDLKKYIFSRGLYFFNYKRKGVFSA